MLGEPKGRILVVDDEPDLCELLQSELEYRGFSVETALCVNEGMDILQSTGADVVVSDMRMPGKNGLDFLNEVNLLEQRPTFLFMSGYTDVSVQEIFRLGAAGLYSKPLNFELLAQQIERLTQKLKEDFGSRQSSRTATQIPAKVSLSDTGKPCGAEMKNISRGGACFQVFSGGFLPCVGERIQFVFHDSQSSQLPVRGVGTCRWTEDAEKSWTSAQLTSHRTGSSSAQKTLSFGIEFQEIAPECFYAFFQQISSALSVPAPKHFRIMRSEHE